MDHVAGPDVEGADRSLVPHVADMYLDGFATSVGPSSGGRVLMQPRAIVPSSPGDGRLTDNIPSSKH